ncbi:hypothetical protein HK097_006708 [Rhizophlyctis rosea]|uniref:Uncharacterized protein n=1 Tax=Rhizophlyctis rosea TaxID=64517 RepID=A0AAD5X517_9FUNG|nr:hypothetical protein HK097_006708 [Rhizophlyctis rosea]
MTTQTDVLVYLNALQHSPPPNLPKVPTPPNLPKVPKVSEFLNLPLLDATLSSFNKTHPFLSFPSTLLQGYLQGLRFTHLEKRHLAYAYDLNRNLPSNKHTRTLENQTIVIEIPHSAFRNPRPRGVVEKGYLVLEDLSEMGFLRGLGREMKEKCGANMEVGFDACENKFKITFSKEGFKIPFMTVISMGGNPEADSDLSQYKFGNH